MSFALILPFLKPIAHLIQDPEISEVMVNGGGRVFVEQEGLVREVVGVSVADKSLQVAVRNIARLLGDDVSEEKPILDARLPDGSRVAAVLPTLQRRQHHANRPTLSKPVLYGRRTRANRHTHGSHGRGHPRCHRETGERAH